MPLSKKRMRERKRADRVKPDTYIGWRDKEPQPKTLDVKPKDGALQSISKGIKRETDSTAPPKWADDEPLEDVYPASECGVQPSCPDGRYRRDRNE